jgi:hypothetical protein
VQGDWLGASFVVCQLTARPIDTSFAGDHAYTNRPSGDCSNHPPGVLHSRISIDKNAIDKETGRISAARFFVVELPEIELLPEIRLNCGNIDSGHAKRCESALRVLRIRDGD